MFMFITIYNHPNLLPVLFSLHNKLINFVRFTTETVNPLHVRKYIPAVNAPQISSWLKHGIVRLAAHGQDKKRYEHKAFHFIPNISFKLSSTSSSFNLSGMTLCHLIAPMTLYLASSSEFASMVVFIFLPNISK